MVSIYRDWFLSARPWSFTMTAISVSVGGTVAAVEGVFSWPLYFLTLIAAVLMHAASNLINDFDDVRHGVDSPDVPTARYRPHPLMENRLTPAQAACTNACVLTRVLAKKRPNRTSPARLPLPIIPSAALPSVAPLTGTR